jgi:hypothetical protein
MILITPASSWSGTFYYIKKGMKERKEAGVVRLGSLINLCAQIKCVGQLPSLYQVPNAKS